MSRIGLIHACYQYQEKMATPPLGLLYLGSAVRGYGHSVRVLDARLPGFNFSQLISFLENYRPEIIGISALTCEAGHLNEISRAGRLHCPTAMIIAGGPHATAFPNQTLNESAVDVAVIGEGEVTFQNIVFGHSLDTIDGIAYKSGSQIRKNPPRSFIDDLDQLNAPAWDLIDLDEYTSVTRFGGIAGGSPYACVMTSRGCPYHCTYCHTIFGKQFRTHSPGWVASEIRRLAVEYGVREIQILDDTFNLDIPRAREICRLVQEFTPGMKLSFPNGLRGDRISEELIGALKSAGTYRINYAVETASKEIQKLIRKNLELDEVQKAITSTSRHGILTHGFFMVGFPGETLLDMIKTFLFAYRSDLHAGVFSIVNPFPNTELFEQARGKRMIDYKYENYDYICSPINLSDIPDWQLKCVQRLSNILIYMSPLRLFRLWRVMPKEQAISQLLVRWVFRFFRMNTTMKPQEQKEQTKRHYDRYPLIIHMSKGMLGYELQHNLIGQFLNHLKSNRQSQFVLDAGCGCGRISKLLNGACRVIGVDISYISVNTAVKSGVRAVNGDCLTMPIPDLIAHGIVSYGVLHHTPSLPDGLREINRVASPGADIFLGINRKRSLNQLLYEFPGRVLRYLRNIKKSWLVTVFYYGYYPFGILLKMLQTSSFHFYPNLWNQFNDQFMSPHTTFHTDREIEDHCRGLNWILVSKSRSHFSGMWNYWYRKQCRHD